MFSNKQQTVYRYLKRNNIRSGVYKTPLFVLYYNYHRYCVKNSPDKKVSPIEFGRRMSHYFEKGKSGRFAYYLTNVEPPASKRRRYLRRWYLRQWTRMRDGQEKKG